MMTPAHRTAILGLLVLAALSAQAPLHAQEEPVDARKRAEELFRAGRALMEAGRADEACASFEESQALIPAAGTQLNIAVCRERQGRFATAWAIYTESLEAAKRSASQERIAFIEEQLERIQRKVPRVRLEVPPNARVPDLLVERNGVVVPPDLWSVPAPVDAGSLRIRASAKGRLTWVMDGEVREGANLTILIPVLAEEPPAPVAPVATARKRTAPASERRAAPTKHLPVRGTEQGDSPLRTGAWVGGALGVGLLAAGAYFGVRAIQKRSESDEYCRDGGWCQQEGVDLNEEAWDDAHRSNALMGGGVVLAGLSAAVLLWGPQPARRVDAAQPSGISITARVGQANAKVNFAW